MGTSCSATVCLKPQLQTALEGQPCTIAGTFCLGMTTCSGVIGGALTCRRTCTTDANCASTDECVASQNSVRVCERKPPEATADQPCVTGVTRCLGNTTCSGPMGGMTTCRATCLTDSQCASTDECVDGSNSVRVCVPRTPPVMAGEACTPGVSLCITPTACTGLPGGSTTCRVTCTTHAQCQAIDECVTAQGGLKVCTLRPPEAMKGGACTIGVTRCLGGTTCTGVRGEATTCLESCELESDCAATEYCGRGQNDAGVCRPQPIFVEPIRDAESVAPKTGCASAPGGWTGLVALLLAMRRSRSR
jgi:hypothetical protein